MKLNHSTLPILINRYGRFYIGILILSILSTNLVAQEPAYFTIGEEDLKDEHIYTICEGKNHIIYAGTGNGLFAYKHGAFEKIEGPPEQITSAVFDLKTDQNGDIFCMNLTGQIFLLKNNKLELFYQVPPKDLNHYLSYYFDEDNNMIIASNYLMKINRSDKKVTKYQPDRIKNINTFIQLSPKHFIFKLSAYSIYQLKNDHISDLSLVKNDDLTNIQQFILVDTSVIIMTKKQIGQNKYSVYNGNINLDEYIDNDNNRIYYTRNNQEFLVATKKNGFHLYQKEENKIKNKGYWFQHRFISDIFETKDGKLLLGTFLGGIIVVPNRNIIRKNIVPSNEECKSLCSYNGILYFTTGNNNIYSYKEKLKLEKHYESDNLLENIFYAEGFDSFKEDGINNLIYNQLDTKKQGFSSLKDIWTLPNKDILIAHSQGLAIYSKKKMDTNIFKTTNTHNIHVFKNFKSRTKSVCYSPLSNLIYTSQKGQLLSIDSTYQQKNILYQGKDINCRDLFYKDSILYIATQNYGILILENDSLYSKYNTENVLEDNYVKKIKIEGDYLALSTGEGIQIINLKNDKAKTIGTAEGIPKGRIVDFDIEGKDLWVLKDNNIFYINIENLSTIDNKLYLAMDSITVNDEKIDFNRANFGYSENKFVFHTNFNHVLLEKETSLFSKLEEVDKEWTKTSIHDYMIPYKSLAPGRYTFRAYAQYRKQKSDIIEYSFRIKKPFWQQAWFYISPVILTSLLFFLFYRYRLKQLGKLNEIALSQEKIKREKQTAEKEMIASELKALQSQMNPHFIFNALNSIQDLVLLQDIRSSNKYLGKFSDLIRKILLSSKKQFISVEEEIKIIGLYLDLEKLRFGEDLHVELSCDIPIKKQAEIQLPAMFVQPYIENAIKHGLFNKKGEKRLKIIFSLINSQTLECIIEDNGVGQKKAAILKKEHFHLHTGFSTKAIHERIKLLNRTLDKKIELKIIDLEKNGLALGTKIILRFPI